MNPELIIAIAGSAIGGFIATAGWHVAKQYRLRISIVRVEQKEPSGTKSAGNADPPDDPSG